MRLTRTLLALAGVASLASSSCADHQQPQHVHRDALIHHAASSSSSSHSSKRLLSQDQQPAFQRKISKRTQLTSRQKQNFETTNTVTTYPTQDEQWQWGNMSATDPIQASQLVLQNNGMVFNNPALSADDYSINPQQNSQRPEWANLPFIPTGDATVGPAGGWATLPVQPAFDLVNRTVVEGAFMPYYVSSGYNPALIKRAIITWPGKPRDCWKYGAFALSALQAAAQNATNFNVDPESRPSNESVLIISPMFLNDQDLADGSVEPNWISFHGSRWQSGFEAQTPTAMNGSITSYDIMDNFTDWLFDQNQFPNLKSVSIIGHSMGGQAAERYALLKKTKPYDDNMRYWIGNPGSWGWLNEDRPYAGLNASCDATFDEWGYGLGGDLKKMTKYGRKQVNASKEAVINRFLSRRINIALALLDNGPGDTHCEALRQGQTHLARGSQFVQDIADVNNGVWPEKFTLSYVANTSHQDFNMFSAEKSLYYIFQQDFDVRYPDLTKVSNPGDVPKKAPGVKAFATPVHKIMAYSLLLGSIACIILAFTLLPCLFPANSNNWEEAAWESEAKRKLI
ncbi:hypothetical protein A4X09_0g4848 [Tilletia walkeri]|uniref:GPI inositol-deacylase n=1 Tax=Tilletia walkeri TaxID=117179 RepID=A0A8X7T3G8_9BASI|nr:hypothetical protein A4X09_0g4848 [Tilletia walkeri]